MHHDGDEEDLQADPEITRKAEVDRKRFKRKGGAGPRRLDPQHQTQQNDVASHVSRILAVGGMAGYGVISEMVQTLVPRRGGPYACMFSQSIGTSLYGIYTDK